MCYEGNKYIRNQISTYEKKYQNPPLYQVPSGLDQVVPVRERERRASPRVRFFSRLAALEDAGCVYLVCRVGEFVVVFIQFQNSPRRVLSELLLFWISEKSAPVFFLNFLKNSLSPNKCDRVDFSVL